MTTELRLRELVLRLKRVQGAIPQGDTLHAAVFRALALAGQIEGDMAQQAVGQAKVLKEMADAVAMIEAVAAEREP